jgi:hypothetical protein
MHYSLMIKIPMLLVMVAVLAGAGCATGSRATAHYVPPSAVSSPAADLMII